LIAGIAFLIFGIMFAASFLSKQDDKLARTNIFARRLFFASLVYLPLLLFLMVIDKR